MDSLWLFSVGKETLLFEVRGVDQNQDKMNVFVSIRTQRTEKDMRALVLNLRRGCMISC